MEIIRTEVVCGRLEANAIMQVNPWRTMSIVKISKTLPLWRATTGTGGENEKRQKESQKLKKAARNLI
jgi:hypothetical protein